MTTWTWLGKVNLMSETESLIIAAENNSIRTNYLKVKIDNTQENSKCNLCFDRDETVNYKINECSKLAPKEYKYRYDRVGKVIHWELCKKLKFHQTKNSICSNQKLSLKMRRIKFSVTFKHKQITQFRLENLV